MDTGLASSESVYINLKSNVRVQYIWKSASILNSVSFHLQSFTENLFLSQLWFITEVKNYICGAGGEKQELRQLLECMSLATLHPPSFRGLTAPLIVTFACFSRVGRLLQNILKSQVEIYPVDSAIQPLNNWDHWGPWKNCSLFLIFCRIRSEPTIDQPRTLKTEKLL